MKAAAYCRYSSDNQREESIEAQTRAIREYAQRNKINIVRIYADEAKSATNANRPQFQKMIKDSRLGIFNLVIVHKLDRFARDRYDSAFYKRELKKNGVRLISVLENLDDSPESIILESVLEGMAEYYSANLAREVMKGMKETALQCKHTGGKPPLGYKVNEDKTYSVDKEKEPIIRLIFSLYANGHGYGVIIDKLNKKGYKTQTGRSFGKNSLHGILKNEKYRGIYVFNRAASKVAGKRNNHANKKEEEIIKIEGGMPRIVDDEIWERVQVRMGNNKRNASNKAIYIYLLSGLVECGNCGGAMVGNSRRSGRNKDLYLSYECSARKRTKKCDMKAINKGFVENTVIDMLEESILSNEAIDELSTKILEYSRGQSNEINNDIKRFEKELKSIQGQIDNIVNAVVSGMFHPSMKEKMDGLEENKASLVQRLEEARLQADIHTPNEEMIKKYIAKDKNIKNKSLEDQKQIIQAYVSKVIVYENDIKVKFIVDINGGGEPYCFISTINIASHRHS